MRTLPYVYKRLSLASFCALVLCFIMAGQTLAHASLHPVAVLLSRELMWED